MCCCLVNKVRDEGLPQGLGPRSPACWPVACDDVLLGKREPPYMTGLGWEQGVHPLTSRQGPVAGAVGAPLLIFPFYEIHGGQVSWDLSACSFVAEAETRRQLLPSQSCAHRGCAIHFTPDRSLFRGLSQQAQTLPKSC